MVNLSICAKCSECGEYSPSRVDDLGRVEVLPSVECGVVFGLTLSGNSELPSACVCLVEQTVSQDDAWDDFEGLKEDEEEM